MRRRNEVICGEGGLDGSPDVREDASHAGEKEATLVAMHDARVDRYCVGIRGQNIFLWCRKSARYGDVAGKRSGRRPKGEKRQHGPHR